MNIDDLCKLNNISDNELVDIQNNLSYLIEKVPLDRKSGIIAGFDSQVCEDEFIVGTICVFDLGSKEMVHSVSKIYQGEIPAYKSGMLVRRELPVFLLLWSDLLKQGIEPDCVVIDGNGELHQHRCGFASHLSFCIDKPTFGIAKTLIGGSYNKLDEKKGSYSTISYLGEDRGVALRTKTGTNPIFISIGNRMMIQDCISIALEFSKFRIPELTRQPDIRSREICNFGLS